MIRNRLLTKLIVVGFNKKGVSLKRTPFYMMLCYATSFIP